MKIVLLGSTGFVGKAILRQLSLLNVANLHVKALVRKEVKDTPAFVHLAKGDLFNIPEELWFAEPYIIIHFATKQIDHDHKGFEENNVRGTQHLIRNIKGPCLGIIYGSSMSVYGDGPHISVAESSPVAPVTELAKSRANTEELIFSSMKKLNKYAFCLRPRFIIGEGDMYTTRGMIKLARRGIKIGSGKQKFNVIDVDDYANIILDLCKSIFSFRIPVQQIPLNIGYRKPLSFNDWLGTISRNIKVEWPKRTVPVNRGILNLVGLLPFRATEKLSTQLNLVGIDHTGSVDKLYELVNLKKYEKDPVDLIIKALAHETTHL